MKLVISLVVLLAAGCRSTFYEDARVKIYIDTMFLDSKASQIAVTCGEKSTTVRVGEVHSDGAAVAGSVVAGVVTGLK